MKLRRRDFLKSMGLAGAGSLMFSPAVKAFTESKKNKEVMPLAPQSVKDLPEQPLDIGTWTPSTCQGCTSWCPMEILVQNGRAVKARGNQNSNCNPGTLCPKGHLNIQESYDPDRVKMPLKRTNPLKGKGIDPGFVPTTWNDALDILATKMADLRTNNEPEKLLVFRGRYSYNYPFFYDIMPKIFGTPNAFAHSSICAEAEKAGRYFTEGKWMYADYDLPNCKYLLLWAVDPFRSNRLAPRTMKNFNTVKTQGKVVVIDPVLTSSAAKADTWVPVIPGTDGALASAIAHHILVNGLWYKTFVGDWNPTKGPFVANTLATEADFTEIYTKGIVKWWNLELKDKTPEWAAPITGISAATIKQIATDMSAVAPNVAVWTGPGIGMTPKGTYTSMAAYALNMLMGSLQNTGGVFRAPSATIDAGPSISSYQDSIATTGLTKKKVHHSGSLTLPGITDAGAGKMSILNDVPNAILDDYPYEIKVCIGNWCNFTFSGCDTQRWEDAMAKIPFFAHITTHASEMSQFADIILPAAFAGTEKWSVLPTSANLYSETSIQQPVATRLFDVRADETEVMYLLAQKLATKGFSNLLNYYNTEITDPDTLAAPTTEYEFAEYATKRRTKTAYQSLSGGWTEYKTKGVVSYGPAVAQSSWASPGTTSGKFEFYSETLKAKLDALATTLGTTVNNILSACNYVAQGDLAFVPHYEPPLRHGSVGSFPFTFIDAKSRYNREGRSQNLPFYYQFKKLDPGDENWSDVIKINPLDAAALGIISGDTVKVTSTIGSMTCKAKVWEGLRPGTVSKCYGQGHWAYGRFASLDYATATPSGGSNNAILVEDYDRLTGATARNGGFVGVKIEKI